MKLSDTLTSQFVDAVVNKTKQKEESTVYGTVVMYDGSKYVRIDGSELLTPAAATVTAKEGERVTVLIKNHTATINGNLTSPSARTGDVEDVKNQVVEVKKVITEDLVADRGRIDELVSENVVIKNRLTASEAEIGDLAAENVEITGRLDANEAYIKKLDTEKLSAVDADIKFATIGQLTASDAKIDNLDANYANIKTLLSGQAGVGDLISIHITSKNAVIENEVVRNAVMESVSVGDLLAGTISTNKFHIVSDDGGIDISGATQQWRDKNGKVRIQIGRDAKDDFTFSLFDETGTGVLIDHTGVKPGAIGKGLIVDSMVNDNAAINAGKLDIKSLFSAINGSEETIKSNRIWLDGEKQTLDQVYMSLKTDVGDMDSSITEIKSGIEGLGVRISETKEEVAGVRKNGLIYNVSYNTNEDGTTTLKAVVYKDGKDATKEYPERWFSWKKKTESGENFLGYGYSITVKNEDYAFGGVVVGRFTTNRDITPAASQGLLTVGGKTLRVNSKS